MFTNLLLLLHELYGRSPVPRTTSLPSCKLANRHGKFFYFPDKYLSKFGEFSHESLCEFTRVPWQVCEVCDLFGMVSENMTRTQGGEKVTSKAPGRRQVGSRLVHHLVWYLRINLPSKSTIHLWVNIQSSHGSVMGIRFIYVPHGRLRNPFFNLKFAYPKDPSNPVVACFDHTAFPVGAQVGLEPPSFLVGSSWKLSEIAPYEWPSS